MPSTSCAPWKCTLCAVPERLSQIRSERRPDSKYASLANCKYEVDAAMSLMRQHGMQVRPRRRYVATTDSNHEGPIFPNLAKDLTVDGPDQPSGALAPAASQTDRPQADG